MVTIHAPIAHARLRPLRFSFGAPLAMLREARPGVQLVFLMRIVASSGVVRHPTIRSAIAVTAWILMTIAIYVFNGVTDVTADLANQSSRPIAAGLLRLSTARAGCVLLAAVGITMCCLVSLPEACVGLAMLWLGWAYSCGPSLKNNPAGFAAVIGAGAAMTYAAGWISRGHVAVDSLALALSVSLWVGLCCASKDFSDLEGDRVAGRRTWPVILGPRTAARLLAAVAVFAACCVVLSTALTSMNPFPAAAICLGSVAVATTAIQSAAAQERTTRRRPYKAFLATQYATNIAIMIFVGT